MRIDHLTLRHFKGFESKEFSFHPEFNLLVGKNGTGKTSALDALSVAAGSWFLGIRGADTRHISNSEVQLVPIQVELVANQQKQGTKITWEERYPCEVAAQGLVRGKSICWARSNESHQGRTTSLDAAEIKRLASEADKAVREGGDVELPLIVYYGVGRLWQEPKKSFQIKGPDEAVNKREMSRFAGYKYSVDPRLSVRQLTQWIAQQSWITFQQNGDSQQMFESVKKAMVGCVEDAKDFFFDPKYGEVIVEMETGFQPFSNLSDGQRSMLAMVGDMAQKAAKLNPQFGSEVLQRTQGVVLIDELDLHLHPRWQRRIVDDLRQTFPKVQFICTTHSPFLIQAIQQGQLIHLDSQVPDSLEYANQPIEDIAEFVQGVEVPQCSKRAEELNKAAGRYYSLLQEAEPNPDDLAAAEIAYNKVAKRYSANPGLSAILELEAMAKKKGGSA